jgi:serine/threonine protein kinase
MVWKAVLDESATTGNPEYQVAAKTVRKDASLEARDDLLTEAAVMAQLVGHTNLVSIVGVVTSGSPLILLLSYCDHGSLSSYLKKRVANGIAVSVAHKLDFATQTANGMAHLAEKRFVHRDLAARNILLASGQSASNLVCKVADFGLSRRARSNNLLENEDYYRSQKGVFSVRWTAPEAMESLVFNQASDVWSFGVVLMELVQDGDKPYHDLRRNCDVMALTMSGKRHPQPQSGCSDSLYGIMTRCWDAVGENRPTFFDLVLELGQLCTRSTVWGEDIDACTNSSLDVTASAVGETHDVISVATPCPGQASDEKSGSTVTSEGVEYEALVLDADRTNQPEGLIQYAGMSVVASNHQFMATVVDATQRIRTVSVL